eukprot:672868-Alexandrium_andersonii.AAC.1
MKGSCSKGGPACCLLPHPLFGQHAGFPGSPGELWRSLASPRQLRVGRRGPPRRSREVQRRP